MKHFNNVLVYRLTGSDHLEGGELNDQLAAHRSYEPASHQLRSTGFIEPMGVEGEYAEPIDVLGHDTNYGSTAHLIQVRVIERSLPAKVIRRAVEERVNAIQKAESRIVRGSEKQRIKTEVVEKLLPRAFTISSDIHILLTGTFVYIDQTSRSKAEDALQLLREALGTLPVVPLLTRMDPSTSMSIWALHGDSGVRGLRIGNSFKLEDVFEGGSTLSGSHLDLSDTDSELLTNLSEGRAVTELGLILSDPELGQIGFTLTEKYVIKGIEWPSEFLDRAADALGEDDSDVSAYRVNTMLVLSGLKTLLNCLVPALGGIQLSPGLGTVVPADDQCADSGEDLI